MNWQGPLQTVNVAFFSSMVKGQFIIGHPRIYMHETFREVGFHMSTLTAYETSPKAAYTISTEYQLESFSIVLTHRNISVKSYYRLSQDLKVLRFVSINIVVAPDSHSPLVQSSISSIFSLCHSKANLPSTDNKIICPIATQCIMNLTVSSSSPGPFLSGNLPLP